MPKETQFSVKRDAFCVKRDLKLLAYLFLRLSFAAFDLFELVLVLEYMLSYLPDDLVILFIFGLERGLLVPELLEHAPLLVLSLRLPQRHLACQNLL